MQTTSVSHCLVHQRPETSTSLAGAVCACCKQTLYLKADWNDVRGYWESQPGAYHLNREPIFVYVRQVDGIQLRSLRDED